MQHAVKEGFSRDHVTHVVLTGMVVESYPERKRCLFYADVVVYAAMTGIPAMVCPRCGTEYVPAEIAGDVIDTVSRTIDQTEALLKRTEAHRRTLAPPQHALGPERLELALLS